MPGQSTPRAPRVCRALRDRGATVLRLKPLAQAIALLVVASGAQAAPAAFSSSWFAAKGAAQAAGVGRTGAAQLPGAVPALAQQQRADTQLQRSLLNLNNTVAAIAAQQAAQAAGRQAALATAQTVPDGLGEGGLKVDTGLTQGWLNAQAPQQASANGKTTVSIKQSADKAILNWETFNVGRNTQVAFQQNSDWAVLNRVNDPNARASQIQGQITGAGTVMLVNRNGIVFSGSSQVNVRNLVAAATTISDAQFTSLGLYSANSVPSFSAAAGAVLVEQGASLATSAPASSTAGGGYVILLGKQVDNAGTIATPGGQVAMAAGDNFVISAGVGTTGNLSSTTRGSEIAVQGKGSASNTGLLQAATGDITLAANQVAQNGVALASTSVNARGTLHLQATGSDAAVTLGTGSTSAIVLDASATALDSQRASLLAPAQGNPTSAAVLSADPLRRDQSLVQISSAGTVEFQSGSMTLATGGQVAVSAGTRSLLRDGAVVDVSGAVGVQVAMADNSIKVNIQGNEQRDASVSRDAATLNNSDVWVDVRDLVRVPAGTDGYATDRWYTAGGLLEVSGYLGTTAHGIGEWMAQGGTVSFSGASVVSQPGSLINLSGGSLDVQAGTLQLSWLKGSDGRLYEASNAPGDLAYTGVYKGFESTSARWGRTEYFYNPLIAPQTREEAGYTVGRDAGTLIVGTRQAVLEGTLAADTFQGDRQTAAPQAGLDGYAQAQTAVARGARLVVGSYQPLYQASTGRLAYTLGADASTASNVVFSDQVPAIAASLGLSDALPAARAGTLYLDSALLDGSQLGALSIAATGRIQVDAPLQVLAGGEITLYAPQVQVNGDLTARGGAINLGNLADQLQNSGQYQPVQLRPATGRVAQVEVAQGVVLDASGQWSNRLLAPDAIAGLPWRNGGSVSLRSTGAVLLDSASLVTVDGGAVLGLDGVLQGGKGGDLTLAANGLSASAKAPLLLAGDLHGYGVSGAGTLTLQAGAVQVGEAATPAAADTLVLGTDFFRKGFGAYDITGNQGLTVTDATQVQVLAPVLRAGAATAQAATGSAAGTALELWTPPLFEEDPVNARLTQRQGASVSLSAGNAYSTTADLAGVQLRVGEGASLDVDPGQAITLQGIGQVTLEGALNAWSGTVTLRNTPLAGASTTPAGVDGISLWLGTNASIDVAGRAVTALDNRGRTYGQVDKGGSIVISDVLAPPASSQPANHSFVVINRGATLDASGAAANLYVPGQGLTAMASDGGSIVLSSMNGLYLDGSLLARAGGAGAAGGSLDVRLRSPIGSDSTPDARRNPGEIIISQRQVDGLPADAVPGATLRGLDFGHARLSADQVASGGFGSLSLLSQGAVTFEGDVNLALSQAIVLSAGAFAQAAASAGNPRVNLAAPYVELQGTTPFTPTTGDYNTGIAGGVSTQTPLGTLQVQADLIDVQGPVTTGTRGTLDLASGGKQVFDRAAFADVNLISQGDLRFLVSAEQGSPTQLVAPGNLLLAAAQLYPVSGAVATVRAGYRGGAADYAPGSSLVIQRTTSALPSLPLSAGGQLTLAAATIEQGGIVRAPLGTITLGTQANVAAATRQLSFLPGSETSVSAAGLQLPYGGTVDGVTWQYDGASLTPTGVGKPSILLASEQVQVQAGATLDLSGGGSLLGAGFVSGRGGSTDARFNPLMQVTANGGFDLPGLSTNPVYAIVPGVQPSVAPQGGEAGAVQPLIGQQITLGGGVPGLPAGTYTLLPSTYALLPGAYRVELNGQAPATSPALGSTFAMRNGSWASTGTLSIANTDIHDTLARQVILTSADRLRSYSQYNETSYASFVAADATRVGVPRGVLEADGKNLQITLSQPDSPQVGLQMAGTAKFQAAAGGYAGGLYLLSSSGTNSIEILADGAAPQAGQVSVRASDLNALQASRLVIGHGPFEVLYGQAGNYISLGTNGGENVTLRSGAVLRAPEVFLVSNWQRGGITLEDGSAINTLGQGPAAYDSDDGYIYQPGNNAVVAVSNGRLQMLAPQPATLPLGPGSITVGAASLYSEGAIAFATDNTFSLSDAARYGTRNLSLAVGSFNVGSPQALADATLRQALPPGLALNQDIMDRLLRGDTSVGAPALENLTLTAAQSLNFFGTTTLSTLDSQGHSMLSKLVLGTPAIYGYGQASDVALIQTADLIWNGASGLPGAVATGGPGTGSGTLAVQAQRIEFGYAPDTQPDNVTSVSRLALGFANVNLSASERITANHRGSLQVAQSQGAYQAVDGYLYSGGNLTLDTPLLTGEAASVNALSAGGVLSVVDSRGPHAAPATDSAGLGAALTLAGASVNLDSRVVLPSGKLTVSAGGDVRLGDAAQLDLAGRAVTLADITQYSWGGDLILASQNGNIRQAAGSLIDVSAQYNHAGSATVTALGAGAGQVELLGGWAGDSSGDYDAGGTLVPYARGSATIKGQGLGDFVGLNQRLNQGEMTGARGFVLKQGDLVVGDEVKANQVDISVDNGSLTVLGTVDASGAQVGSIRLAANNGLTLAGSAVLDAHGSLLRVDSYGKIIDAANRAVIELNAGNGQLTLASGARLDLRDGTAATAGSGAGQNDGGARGSLTLTAPRLGGATAGDVAIDARGPLQIDGAQAIVVNANQCYSDAPFADTGVDPAASGHPYQVIDQAYLNAKDRDSQAFMTAALGNANLLGNKLAGLDNSRYASAFHLRPGVEIVTAGDLVVSGDLDLSGFRYASLNPGLQRTTVYGSGEPGNLVIRAGGNLDIYGSINDGFAPPPATPDDNGWVLTPGLLPFGGDVVVPGSGVVLATGTFIPAAKTLNYDFPIQASTLAAGTVLPVAAALQADLTLPAGTVLRGAISDAGGHMLYAAGTLLAQAVTLPGGSVLGAGSLLPSEARMAPMTWPAGVPLPHLGNIFNATQDGVLLASDLTLKVGALIPALSNVVLPGGALSVPLNTVNHSTARQNWAVASLLPEGSQSWSLRLVAGADTQAADTRAVKPDFKGNLTLADTHYSIYEIHQVTITPGQPARPGGANYWTAYGQEVLGVEPGTLVTDDWGTICADLPGACEHFSYAWTADGADLANAAFGLSVVAGDPVQNDLESICDASLCASLGEALPATPPQTVIGALTQVAPVGQLFSVLRTGTGDLDLVAAGNVALQSSYGVYTAGTSSAAAAGSQAAAFNQPRSLSSDGNTVLGSGGSGYEALVSGGNSLYSAWYPRNGGNLLVKAGGDLTGDLYKGAPGADSGRSQLSNGNLSDWLWRQGTGSTAGVTAVPTSWWINFGTYVTGITNTASVEYSAYDQKAIDALPYLVGFTGFGTLGGGNLDVQVSGDAGLISPRNTAGVYLQTPRGQGLALAVGSTGRVTQDGQLMLTGGGDLRVKIGGDLNPGLTARASISGLLTAQTQAADYNRQTPDINGVISNLRGAVTLDTGSLGGIALAYGLGRTDVKDTRADDPFTSSLGAATGGITLMLGDSVATLSTRGDLVLNGAGDPGRVSSTNLGAGTPFNSSAVTYEGIDYSSGGSSWFSLWTPHTAINLFSAGGNLAPSTQAYSDRFDRSYGANATTTDGRFVYPSRLSAIVANGSLYLGKSALYGVSSTNFDYLPYSLLLAPSTNGSLQMLAQDSIYAGGYAVSQSGASLGTVPTPFAPAFGLYDQGGGLIVSNLADDAILSTPTQYSLFSFGSPTYAGQLSSAAGPARFTAATGDIVGLRSGEALTFTAGPRAGQTLYEGAGPVWMVAGRDIVNSGSALGAPTALPDVLGSTPAGSYQGSAGTSSGNLFIQNDPTDVSIVSAGRDILFSSFQVAGPGTLEVTAGRNLQMDDRAAITSLGAVLPGDSRAGASIAIQAGAGTSGLDYLSFVTPYLRTSNVADASATLASQPGKVVKSYVAELQAWLAERYGFSGSEAEALAYYTALPAEQQRVFARQVYFAEVRAGGREYNNADSPRYLSFLRARNAIAGLLADTDVAGNPIVYNGNLTMYGGAGIHTLFGGDIQVLTPGGQQVYGIEGTVPPASAGVTTQGAGDIDLYAQGSILLGQSRIMTTFGGDILAWSAAGDINAGRGAKSTVVFTPPKRVYDQWGNVTLSPTVPSTGAGIATLAPIPEVPAGDIDLLAPLGTIDAGEAGIRVSGNVNIFALQVVNAANIQVQGTSQGVPVVAAVNTNAISAASAAAASATDAAQNLTRQQQDAARKGEPSVFAVKVLSFGSEPLVPGQDGASASPPAPAYDPASPVQVLGAGELDEQARRRLTAQERGRLML